MPHVVYALFEDPRAADRVRAALVRGGKDGPGLDVRAHERRLDANQLPEDATSFGRNMVVTTTISTVFFTARGRRAAWWSFAKRHAREGSPRSLHQ